MRFTLDLAPWQNKSQDKSQNKCPWTSLYMRQSTGSY